MYRLGQESPPSLAKGVDFHSAKSVGYAIGNLIKLIQNFLTL